jgi:hypothetical protein
MIAEMLANFSANTYGGRASRWGGEECEQPRQRAYLRTTT